VAAGLALLIELSLYAGLAFEKVRAAVSPYLTAVSGAVIYAVYSVPTGVFSMRSAALLLAAGLLVMRWFRGRQSSAIRDILFVVLAVAPLLARIFPTIYARPTPDLKLDILGHLFWIRAGLMALLEMRPQPGLNFGFWPQGKEWRTGLVWFILLAPVAALLVIRSGFAHYQKPELPWWQTAGLALAIFFGILWVVALSEEFLFRGLLLQWIAHWTHSDTVGLVAAALLFGAAHLGYRQYPNWRFAAIAAVAGLFYGMAFRRGPGLRAAMVTHALTVTAWKTFFR